MQAYIDLNKELSDPFPSNKVRFDADGHIGINYLDPRTSRLLTTDPALGDYIPMAPTNDEARKHNQNLPGGGIYNTFSTHLYNYANNNPVKYTDPTGKYLQIFVSKSKGTMEVMYTKPGDKNTYAIADTTAVITNVNKNFPDNSKMSDTSRTQKHNGTNPTQIKSGTYKLTEARAPSSGKGKFGTGKQGLVIAFSQMLEVVDGEVNPETGERERVSDSGYMIHITPFYYTDGCTGIPYDPNDPESKEKAEALIDKLVDIFEQTMSEKGDKNATITIMD